MSLVNDSNRPENIEMLERNIGKWSTELSFKRISLFGIGIVSLTLILIVLQGISAYYEDSLSQDNSELFSQSLPFFFQLFLFSVCLAILILVIYLVVPWFSRHKRYYITFKVRALSNEESEFSLSSFTAFFSLTGTAKPVESQWNSLLEKKHNSLSSSATNEFQFNTFKMVSRGKPFTTFYVNSFVIALDESKNEGNTFIFYSRHSADWKFIQKQLEINNLTVETVGYRATRIQ